MAFNGFTDRVVQYPGRIILTPVQGEANTYDMSRAEGTVTADGTPFNAETFNGIADDIIQTADDNIITENELAQLESLLGVTGVYGVLNKLAQNAVIDSGTSNGWSWKKYADGTFEASGRFSNTTAINTSSGAVYFSTLQTINTPDIGISSLTYFDTVYCGGEGTWTKGGNITNQSVSFAFCSAASRSSTTRTVMAILRGTYS